MADMGEAQFALNSCQTHSGEELDMYCCDCSLTICEVCVKDNHLQHHWSKISKAAGQLRQKLYTRAKEIEKRNLVKLQKDLTEIKLIGKKNEKSRDRKTGEINQRKNELVLAVNAASKILVKECDEMYSTRRKELKKMEHKISETIQILDKQLKSIRDIVSLSDFSVVEIERDLQQILEQGQTFDTQPLLDQSIFAEGGEISKDDIISLVGKIQLPVHMSTLSKTTTSQNPETDLPVLAKFQHKHCDMIQTICPISDCKAWINRFQSQKNELIEIKAEVQEKKFIGKLSNGFTVMENGDQIYGDSYGMVLRKVSLNGKVTDMVKTAPLHPLGISKSLDGGLLVCFVDKYSWTVHDDSVRRVDLLTSEGKSVVTLQYRSGAKTSLFMIPAMAVQNYNDDICVINKTSTSKSQLCVLGLDHKLKFTYEGQSSQGCLNAQGVVCDTSSRIIVSDTANNCVHVISADGQFLRFILTKQYGLKHPTYLALSKSILWIGDTYGQIMTFSYATKQTLRGLSDENLKSHS